LFYQRIRQVLAEDEWDRAQVYCDEIGCGRSFPFHSVVDEL
jgi:hypothetical protein